MALSPMMTHYLETKKQYPDCILFYRLGDFYEMFFEDAQTVSKELELTLTGKDCGLEERAPMCGVPYHAVEGYLSRLVQKGYKVAIAEQMEDPKQAKGLVKREVIRVVTPGTLTNSQVLEESKNNYLMGIVYIDGERVNMSPKEYELLFYMVKNKNIALSREKIITDVWGYDFFGGDRTLDTHIKILRKSLGKYNTRIVTLRGVGYRFEG